MEKSYKLVLKSNADMFPTDIGMTVATCKLPFIW